jgi:hypothetical protein
MIQLPEMKLIERDEVVSHIATKMAAIDEKMLSEMRKMIDVLGSQPSLALSRQETSQEEDAREHPWETIFQFLFLKFARFAVLSHTWQDNEIIYKDILQEARTYQDRPGYQKVKKFCHVAYKDHNISLAWIDTLCINKESSAELDESIQSMYKWYRNSSVCITHLRNTTSFENMRSDNWFKRGWTLQELLAPKSMQFYHGDSWTRLTPIADGNDKANPKIQKIISDATKIQALDLVSFDPLTGSDIATRMSWAASRITTRGEDRAYSLMGIFGVNFSISYGEGEERAFFRLIEAIISSRHTSHVIQVLNWAGTAISDTIHTSRLIPSRPECYLASESQPESINSTIRPSLYFPTLLEPMLLTHLGLRVRLLLVLVTSVSLQYDPAQKLGPFDLTMRVEFLPSTFQTIVVLLEKRFAEIPYKIADIIDTQVPIHMSSSIFVGIYTFQEDDFADCVLIPHSSSAIILGIPTLSKGFNINTLSSKHFGPTSKIDTRKSVRIDRSVFDNSAGIPGSNEPKSDFILKRNTLQTKNMKLLDVYL